MAIGGTPENFRDLFPDELVPDILELVVETWKIFAKPQRTEHEVPITKDFCLLLQRQKNATSLPFKIRWELPLLDSTSVINPGRADLIFDFINTSREEIYFLFECKRLCVPFPSGWQSQAGEYIGDDGMMCFIFGKYSSGLPAGGMIGYVMDGNVLRAISSVTKAVEDNRDALCLAKHTGLQNNRLMPKNDSVKETDHDLSTRNFMMHHIFLKV